MAIATNLGFPRLGANRELKRAIESYWAGKIDENALLRTGAIIRRDNWLVQQKAGITHVPSNDFSLYDQVLDTTAMLGAIPERFGHEGGLVSLDTYFAMARGTVGDDETPSVPAMDMTKWFDTNYHYIVPELEAGMKFKLSSTKILDEFVEAREMGILTRPVLLGPVTFLMLCKTREPKLDPLAMMESILPVYEIVLKQLAAEGAEWIQVDEPMLGMDLDDRERSAFGLAFARLSSASSSLKLLATIYFGDLRDNLRATLALQVAGIHIDLVRGPEQLDEVMAKLPPNMVLSIGLVDGRNIWKTDLTQATALATKAVSTLSSERVMIGPSCSLLHCPVDLNLETGLDAEMRSWMSFAKQKVREIAVIAAVAGTRGVGAGALLAENAAAMESRRSSRRIHNPLVEDRAASVTPEMYGRTSPYEERQPLQKQSLKLPQLPTTTIGSFPQTPEIRKARASLRSGQMSPTAYQRFLKKEIEAVVRFQEEIGLDVLVHGEAERNDMVEYFGEQLEGYISTTNGWVQSFGTRAVKPPIIFGDISRPEPMTVKWAAYAQSLTDKPVKGMLTGPITMLEWSFVRDDQPRSDTCRQLALAIRDEVLDLEKSGIRIIQVDEPAMREGLPLRRADWAGYLAWAVECFKLTVAGVTDRTQIHTHMCYADFNDIIESIGEMDADVISMEASRSGMELLSAFGEYRYPNQIGPGVYDIHSPRLPSADEMKDLLVKALDVLGADQVWVNPDCGLKTQSWEEVRVSLGNMVDAARSLR
ncbi:MAG: 5-methyltetrahydropteroyltriglutamate--homocysteine S-methyltransferase [Chloroflexi bacterium]|nr:5-methyltetrahydropteroyltriglutamate--homocysteine S-methyltransferase [Chloroflexota bacterium]MDA1173789.1 5-methyltetrahydropteroyltriglutamate--homocysteine S-methyltransferase [Chloroflexota bacterium]